MVWQLDDDLWFPNPRWGEDDGLVAIGGDLSVERLLLAYSNGFFPWYAFQMEREPHWYCPLDRYVIFPHEIHVSHSMRQLIRQRKYEVTVNQDFDGVIRGCATAQGRNEESGAWLGPNIIEAFTRLHRLGYATSVEVWERLDADKPRPDSPSVTKAMETIGGHFIDCQFETPLFKSMGGRHITYDRYMDILNSHPQDTSSQP